MAALTDVGFCQKAVTEFLSIAEIAPKKISERLKIAFGDNVLCYATG